jgi:hypothetical protein
LRQKAEERQAHDGSAYKVANTEFNRLKGRLELLNEPTMVMLEEGFSQLVGISLKATSCIESFVALVKLAGETTAKAFFLSH